MIVVIFSVWGFGAKYGGKVRHLFQCGGSPTACGTQGVLDAYRTVFETDLIMSGPTVINSVLRQAAARARKLYDSPPSTANMGYCVLMILTDGIVNDLQSTQELVRSYRNLQLPLSVLGEAFSVSLVLYTVVHHVSSSYLFQISGWNWAC